MDPAPAVFWLVRAVTEVPDGDDWLGDEERVALSAFAVPKRRAEWRLGRWAAKAAVSSFLARDGSAPARESIDIRAASDGAPEALLGGRPAGVNLSISHRSGMGFCVVAPIAVRVGCDVEAIESRSAGFVRDFFGESEARAVHEAPPREQPLLATAVWSAKESMLKLLRDGLRRDTREVTVEIVRGQDDASWNRFTAILVDSSLPFYGWWRTHGPCVLTVVADPECGAPLPLDPSV